VKGHLRRQGNKDKKGNPTGTYSAVFDQCDAAGKRRRRWVTLPTTDLPAAEDALHRLPAEAQAGGLPRSGRVSGAGAARTWRVPDLRARVDAA
jgi:hypothetical protein